MTETVNKMPVLVYQLSAPII